ncbi:MAG: hypothetical protein NC299_05225 [Lachnospiraceae bacterium]|nr:hypothetical protein [Ruminococcus sp.]MCM1274753.1 hypothetical protein [Lachnospiraceae bacterium]
MLGYVVCGILAALCILLIIAAAVFGSRNTVDIVGFNIYIVQSDNITTAPKNSAVIVKKTSAYYLDEGNLVMYLAGGEEKTPALGYVKAINVSDGSYIVTVTADGNDVSFADSELVGRADYSSVFLGKLILFIRTPLGVLFIALLPCIALVVYDFVKAAASKIPPPEVVPQMKNFDGDSFGDEGRQISAARASGSKIAVSEDGKATYSRSRKGKQPEEAGGVLFSYSGKQQKKTEDRPIIPLTDKKSSIDTSVKLPEKPSSGYTSIINVGSEPTAAPKRAPEPPTPSNVAKSRYARSTETAELPSVPKKDAGDAFFAQTDAPTFNEDALKRLAPQIGRAGEKPGVAAGRTARTSRKRSTEIIASKGLEDLFADDDDT